MNHTRRLASIPVWPVWGTERLKQEKEGAPRNFQRGFQMHAFTDDERMFRSFRTCFSHGISPSEISRRGWPVFAGVDLAGPKRPGNVIFVVALETGTMRRYPLEVIVGSWTSPELAREIAGVNIRHPNLRIIMVENNGYQQALIDWVRSSPVDHSFWYKIEPFTTGANKNAQLIGLPSLEIEFKNRAWVVPADEFSGHSVTCRCGWCTWVSEVDNYPMSATTDTVMAMWFAREGIAKWGFSAKPQRMGDINSR